MEPSLEELNDTLPSRAQPVALESSQNEAIERVESETAITENVAMSPAAPNHNDQMSPQTTDVHIETRPGTHRYWFRRPQALQYVRDGNYVQNIQSQWQATSSLALSDENEENCVPTIRRRQLDIFLDLLWVGIIGSLSDLFVSSAFDTPDPDYGHAFVLFIALFMMAWQIWNFLRRFLNEYYLDDLVQRAFVVWILVLALMFGNTAPYFLEGFGTQTLVIFLIARGSFLAMESLYSLFFIPELRRLYRIHLLLSLPAVVLNVGAIFTQWPKRAALLIIAFLWESVIGAIIESPLGDHMLQGNVKKAANPEHYVERLENFFIIILGNGVFILIQGSPLGAGLTANFALGVKVLIIYYFLFCLYFGGDGSKNYIHPVRRSWWSAELWLILHVQMYAAILLLEAALITLVHKSGNWVNTASEGSPPSEDSLIYDLLFTRQSSLDEVRSLHTVKWTASISIFCALLLMTGISLLCRSLDPPGTLLISSRYIRLAPRVAFMITILCVPLKLDMSIGTYLTVMVVGLVMTALFEWGSAKIKDGGIWEPRRRI